MTHVRILNDNLVVQTQNPGQLRAVYPGLKEATIRNQVYCALPFTLEAARVLNNIGIKAPSPIRHCYDWPGRYKPRWYQLDTAEFLTLNSRAYCLNGMRTGKTLSSLWASDFLRQQGKIQRTLIVAPLSTLWDVWEQNIFESFPLRTFAVLHGSRQKRLDLLERPHDFYIINHHGVQIIEEVLRKRPDIDHIIIDEVAVFRNAKAKTLWKPLNEVLNRHGVARSCWGLTGSPTPQEPTDAFGQCKLVTPENYRGHFTSFKHETMHQVSQFKWLPKANCETAVAKVLKPSIRFERSVCSDMEPCYIDRRAELSPEQQKAYKELIRQAVSDIRGQTVTAVNAAVLLSKLCQIACGVAYDATGAVAKLDFGPRLKVLEELIEENNEKVLVFVPFTGALNALADALRKRWSVDVIDGNVSAGKRTQIFREFRSSKDPHILVCHPGTMAHGLDLTTASLSIWYAPYPRAEIYQQANARMDGSRQTTKIDIAHIYATAEEKRLYSVLKDRGRFQDVVLEMVKRGEN